MQRAIIYSRVSTKKQDTSRQINELKEYAAKNDIQVEKVFEEQISGRKPIHKREKGSEFLEYLKSHRIKLVLVSELSRLGRSTKDLLNTFDLLSRNMGVNIYIHDKRLNTLEDGKVTPMAEFMFTILSAAYNLEIEQTKERILSGLEEARRKGKKLGRPKGSTKNIRKVKNYSKIKDLLSKGVSIREAAKAAEVSPMTIQKVKKRLE